MRFRILISLLFLLLTLSSQGQQTTIDTQDLQKHLSFLASDSLKGRFPGTAEDAVAGNYIRDFFREKGLKLAGDGGFQDFSVVTSVEASPNNSLSIAGVEGTYGKDFSLYAFSSNAGLSGEVVFAGFGIAVQTDELKWNDYSQIDVKNKWVLVLRGDPEPANNDSKFIPYADARSKALFAKDRGAKGLLVIGGKQNDPKDELVPLLFERSVISAGLPVIDLKRSWAAPLLFQQGISIDSLESLMMKGENPVGYAVLPMVSAHAELVRNEVTTRNIMAMIPGCDPVLKSEFVVIGAHYDHLGFGGLGSGSRTPDTLAVHHGADDNGSGTAGLMELAASLAQYNGQLKRSVMFVAFSAEEMGLLGSKYFVGHTPMPKENIVAMLNMDMIGRLNEKNSIVIGGTGTSLETEALLKETGAGHPLSLSLSPEGFGASDHASFYAENIPVMFFSTGAHADYHTPSDTWDRINYQGMAQVISLVSDVAVNLLNRDTKLTFQEAGPKERTTGRRGFKVTLGIMPDFTSTSSDGLGVGGVTKGGPADKAGMLKGDKIVAVDGMPVGTIYDYMNRLKQLKPGQRVNVDVVREGKVVILIVDL
ncbi:MAG: M20/M25/M40 family metallo-hydrolase [Bacteroidales bacterium]|nr:M20/M25/M40 family metallo-hydrolase [Bacteroidales bacterium]